VDEELQMQKKMLQQLEKDLDVVNGEIDGLEELT